MAKPPPKELPPRYYLEYFEYLLSFMEEHYGDLLSSAERNFIDRYRQLPVDAQCLTVRLANRRGEFFLLDTFRYEEITDMILARQSVAEAGFILSPDAEHEAFFPQLLEVFNKAFLVRMARDLEVKVKASWRKPQIVEALLEQADFADAVAYMHTFHDLVMCTFGPVVHMFKFLFFGNTYEDLTQFVVRDIGYVKYENTGQDFTPLFRTRKEAEDKLHVLDAYEYYKVLIQTEDPDTVLEWYEGWTRENLGTLSEVALPAFDKLTLRLGQWLERAEYLTEALSVYERTQASPAPERRIRLLHKLGDTEQAVVLAEHLVVYGISAEERLFAGDFIRKQQNPKQRRRRTTEKLKAAEEISISASFTNMVELGVAQYFAEQGFAAVITENSLWRSLFGLLFWEEIFAGEEGVFHHPLQRMPSDLFGADFLPTRREAMAKKMTLLYDFEAFEAHVMSTFEAKKGIANPFTGWHPQTPELVLQARRVMTAEQLEPVLWEIARDPKENGRGFPDLFLWKELDYAFVEVKSPNDHLGPQQWYWLEFFEQHGIQARIIRVRWDDPTAD